MKTRSKLQVFLAHSFDKEPPEGSKISDLDVAGWFERLMKSIGWKVVTGKRVQARPIGDKIAEDVNASKAVVAIFTGRHSAAGRLLPSAWVLCECAYALGRFEGSDYIVAGFREKGVAPKDLALLTVGGMEFPEFERDSLPQSKASFLAYLRDVESRILSGSSGQLTMLPVNLPYKQVRLHKIYLVYRNGYCTVHNINEIVVHDPERFFAEHKGRIRHHIWNHRAEFPALDSMMQNPIYQRKQQPFFYAKLDYHRKKLDMPLAITLDQHNGKDLTFFASFRSPEGEPLRLKPHDTIRYQYAWGLPKMYPVFEEELAEVRGDDITPDTYCLAEVAANRGPIDHLTLELRFEREAKGTLKGELFSKSPFFQIARGFVKELEWSTSRPLPPAKDEPREYDLWYEIYKLDIPSFDGKLRTMWRPSSQKYQL